MSRWFNIAGPCKADKHYMLPPTGRLPDLEQLIERLFESERRSKALPIEERLSTEILTTINQRSITVIRA